MVNGRTNINIYICSSVWVVWMEGDGILHTGLHPVPEQRLSDACDAVGSHYRSCTAAILIANHPRNGTYTVSRIRNASLYGAMETPGFPRYATTLFPAMYDQDDDHRPRLITSDQPIYPKNHWYQGYIRRYRFDGDIYREIFDD